MNDRIIVRCISAPSWARHGDVQASRGAGRGSSEARQRDLGIRGHANYVCGDPDGWHRAILGDRERRPRSVRSPGGVTSAVAGTIDLGRLRYSKGLTISTPSIRWPA
jgi:hypothetical protein